MFKVECPSCSAPYQVDERRVPASGLKMRCPKCGHAFIVGPPGEGAPVELAAAIRGVGSASPSVGPVQVGPSQKTVKIPAVFGPPASGPAVAALRLPSDLPAALVGTKVGGAHGQPKQPPRPGVPGQPPEGSQPKADEAELDLPTVGHRLRGSRSEATHQGAVTEPPDAPASSELPSPRDPARSARPLSEPSRRAFDAETRPGNRGPSGWGREFEGEMDLGLPLIVPSGNAGARVPVRGAPAGPPRPDRWTPSAREADCPEAPDLADGTNLDLPALSGDLDLPSPRAELPTSAGARTALVSSEPGEFSFDADLPAPAFDLPSPVLDQSAFDVDLPSPASDLPSPSPGFHGGHAGLPARAPDLPRAGLPVASAADPGRGAAPPMRAAGLPFAAAGLPERLPAPGVAERPRPPPRRPPPPPARPARATGPEASSAQDAGEHQAGDEFDPFAEPGAQNEPFADDVPRSSGPPEGFELTHADSLTADAAQPPSFARPSPPLDGDDEEASASVTRQTGGGTSFGEVNLEGALDSALAAASLPPPSRASDDDMEFGAIPQETEAAAAAPTQATLGRPAAPEEAAEQRASRRRRRLVVWSALAGTLALGGAALSLAPSLGPYGIYFLTDQLRRGEYQRVLDDEVRSARRALGRDSRTSAEQAMRHVERTLRSYRRVRELAAYGAFIGELIELRFSEEPAIKARADVLLEEQAGDADSVYLNLASAARAAAEGRLALARQRLARVERADGLVDALVVRGELELNAGEPKEAVAHFGRAEARDKSARTAFGLARAHLAAGNAAEASAQAKLTLERNPEHIGARILLARLSWTSERDDTSALSLLEQALKLRDGASALELVDAYTLIGDIHLELSRISLAEAAFGEALKVRPQAARALAGLGDALYHAGRYSEALARFEAAIQVDPDELTAAVGAAKTKIALEKARDASAMLRRLREVHPRATLVHYWYGRAEEALGNRDEAEKAYRTAVTGDDTSTDVVQAYVALAMLMNQQGRTEEAQKTLAQAKERLSDLPEIYRALGQLALAQGRYEEALADFGTALGRNDEDLSSRFYLGVALRRSRKLEQAAEAFDQVAKVDRDYPGLALERGLLYEAFGRTEEALKAYEGALAKAPEDPDLMLRVGCGKVIAGHAGQAAELLRKVMSQRPNSAETHHCLGRALLLEGSNLALALRTLKRAVDLDPNRAEYHLYVGWAANEAGRVVEAESALKQALTLDQGLADAYWQRGVLRYRQGAVKDAVQDLTRAVQLKPGRHEAHAALADCYYDLGREREALEHWRFAIEAQPENATWHYRYGRLLQQNQRSPEARAELEKALELAEETDQQPRWSWEAHRLLARAIGRQPAALKHWQAFLRLSPADNAYRQEAKLELAKLGHPWDGQ